MATAQALEVARRALVGKDDGAAEAAVLALAGPFEPEAFVLAFDALAHPAWKVRRAGAGVLEGFGDAAVAPLSDRIAMASPDQVHWAADVLGRLGPGATGPLLDLVRSPHEGVRRHLATILGRRHERAAVDALTALLADPSWIVRKQAAQALAAHPDRDTVVEATLEAFSSRHPDHLFWGITVLFRVLGRRALALVEKALGTTDAGVRTTVLTALATLRVDGVLPRLVDALSDGSWVVAERASTLVARFGPRASPLLLERIERGPPSVLYAALKALLRADAAQGLSVATRLLVDRDEERRCHVVRALGETATPGALTALASAFKDPSWTVRALASDGLVHAGERAIPPVYRCLFVDDPDLRYWGVRTMARLGKAGLGPLKEAYEKLGREVRLAIVSALSTGEASDEALAVLVDALSDPYWVVRRQAAMAMAAYGPRGIARILVPALTAEGHLGHWARAALTYARPEEAGRVLEWARALEPPARSALLARLEGEDTDDIARLVDGGPEALARLVSGATASAGPRPVRRDLPALDSAEALLGYARAQDAQGLELAPHAPPALVRDGRIEVLPVPALASGGISRLLSAVWPGHSKALASGPRSRLVDISGIGRVKVAVWAVQGHVGARFGFPPPVPPTFAELGLSDALARVLRAPQGVVLVATPPGGGLTSLLSALLARLALERPLKAVSLEPLVEITIASRQGLVVQREVGTDTLSYAEGIEEALARGADAVLAGEVPDPATARAVVGAAAVGRLVIAGVRAIGVRPALERVLGLLGPDGPLVLSGHLRAVVAQVLLPRNEGRGRVPARELLWVTPPAAAAIRQARLDELSAVMAKGTAEGMTTLDSDLARLVASGTIAYSVGLQHARDPRALVVPDALLDGPPAGPV